MVPLATVVRVFLMLSVLSVCAAEAEESPFSVYTRKGLSFRVHKGMPVYEGNDPNASIISRLLPNELEFDRATEGQTVSLHSLFVIRTDDDNASLTIEFRRSDLQESFIQGLFFDRNAELLNRHPFSHPGIEAILTDERLILNIHPGVTLHLREGLKPANGIENFLDFKTFINSNPTGKITKVVGMVFHSSDHEYIRMRLHDFYVSRWISLDKLAKDSKATRTPDGGYQFSVPVENIEVPPSYAPRIVDGP